jgi:hypothetical protein
MTKSDSMIRWRFRRAFWPLRKGGSRWRPFGYKVARGNDAASEYMSRYELGLHRPGCNLGGIDHVRGIRVLRRSLTWHQIQCDNCGTYSTFFRS